MYIDLCISLIVLLVYIVCRRGRRGATAVVCSETCAGGHTCSSHGAQSDGLRSAGGPEVASQHRITSRQERLPAAWCGSALRAPVRQARRVNGPQGISPAMD